MHQCVKWKEIPLFCLNYVVGKLPQVRTGLLLDLEERTIEAFRMSS